ncbi:MAG: DUF2971 domain-containing protein [Bryobacteraceae bacterium]|jgi:hypothetical protein
MDFLKFADLLERRVLWFSRLDKLEDPREGRLTSGTKELIRREVPGVGERMIHTIEHLRSSIFVNCWHASKGESAAMWRLYSPTGYAIAIGSSIGRLRKALAGTPDQVMIGRVTYVDSNRYSPRELRNLFDPSLIKDRSFAHEREVRLLLSVLLRPGAANGGWNALTSRLPDLPSGMRVPVDVSMLIKDVLVDPRAESWVKEVIAKLLERAGMRTAVRQSDLYRLPA